MNITHLTDDRLPQGDQELLQKIPVEEIFAAVNRILSAHGLSAQLVHFSVMHARYAHCVCSEPSIICNPQVFGRALARVEHECYDQCVKLGCVSQPGMHD
ncbi:MAG: hypothetical protein HY731_13830 [Candidatus Tectomicrobia bacterium]|nr:hypothetical protein [Candidatus Tectomicrobia bacterium]